MAETKVNLGMLPVNRGEYSSSAKYYKDNIVQYNGSSYVCTVPIGADIDNPAYSQGTAPYTSDPTQLNTGWATFASGNNTFTTGQNVNSIGVDTIPTAGSRNLVESGGVDFSLSRKVSIVHGKNMLDIDSIINGWRINTDGSLAQNAAYNITPYIEVSPLTTYIISINVNSYVGGSSGYIAFFNEDFNLCETKAVIPNTAPIGVFTTPENCHYVRCSITNANINSYIQLELGDTRTTYESYDPLHTKLSTIRQTLSTEEKNQVLSNLGLSALAEYGQTIKSINGDLSQKINKKAGKNLFDKNSVIDGTYITSSGVIMTSTVNSVSSYIEVDANTTYYLSAGNDVLSSQYGLCYDADFNVIPNSVFSVPNTRQLTTPADCRYIRVTVLNSRLDAAQIEKGSVKTSYEPYDELHKKLSIVEQVLSDVEKQQALVNLGLDSNISLDVSSIKGDVSSIKDDIYGADDTVYVKEGEIAYYTPSDKGFGRSRTAQGTSKASNNYIFNQIIVGPVRCNQNKAIVKCSIIKTTGNINKPYNGTIIKEVDLSIDTTFKQYTVNLDTEVTVLPTERIAVYFYQAEPTSSFNVYILGNESNNPETYAGSNKVYFLAYGTYSGTEPLSQTWNISSGENYNCSPICKYVKKSIETTIKEEVDEEYMPLIEALQEDVNDLQNSVSIELPDKVYAVVGDTLQLFYRGFIKALVPYNYDIRVSCEKGQNRPRYWQYTPISGDVGTTDFTVYVYNNVGTILATKTISLVTVASPVSPQSLKNVFCFGASTTSSGQWPAETKRRLVGTNTIDGIAGKNLSNIAFCGSKETVYNETTINYFGNGGWSWGSYIIKGSPAYRFQVNGVTVIKDGATYTNNGHTYTVIEQNITNGSGNILCTCSSESDTPEASGILTRTSASGDATIAFSSAALDNKNPLWDNTNNKMSFIPYVNEYGNGQIDVCCILLGWNSQVAWKEWNTLDTAVYTFIRTLHTEYPNCKVKIMGIQMPSCYGGMKSYGSNSAFSDYYAMSVSAYNYNKALQDFCNKPEFVTYCEFIGTACQFDAENNYPKITDKVNTRNSAIETIDGNGLHPADSGYNQIADAVYRNFVANFCQS